MRPDAERGEQRAAVDLQSGLEALRQSSEFRGPVEPPDDHEHPKDHLALIYESQEEQFATVTPFIRQGLEQGERCLYVVDENSREEILEAMRTRGIDVDAALDSGALTIHTKQDTYLKDGEFDPDEMVAYLTDTISEALEEYEGFRAIGEMTWILDDEPRVEDFMEYESKLASLYSRENTIGLCQYNRERFPPEIIRDIIRTHPHLVHNDVVSQNVYYTPPEEFLGPDKPAREVDRMLGTLRERTEAKTEVAEHKRFLQELNEITANPNRSFEEKLHDLFDLGCDWFDLNLGALNRIDPDDDRLEVEHINGHHEYYEPGAEFPLSQTYCMAAADIKEAASVSDPPEEGFEDLAVYEKFGVESYLGTYLPVDGGEDRTFAFIAAEPRAEPFSKEDRTYIELMGQWVKSELERKQRETDLQRSKEHFQRIFESTNDAIFIVDPEADELVDANPAASEMIGYPRGELLSLAPSDLHPDELDDFRGFVDDVFEDGSGWTDELTCQTKDRGQIPAEISASRMEYNDRPVMLAAVRDISERKEHERSQQQLYEIAADPDRTFDEKLQAVFELGCDRFDIEFGGLARVDVDADLLEVEVMSGEHEHLVPGEQYPLSETYCRDATDEDGAIAAITDPVSEGFEGKLWYDQFGVRTYLGTYLELEGSHDRTFFFLSNERREEPFSEAERTFHHLMGQWIKYELDHQQYQQDLEETIGQLQQSNNRLKQFAYAASHDLQEPLRMVSSYLQLLEKQYKEDLDEDALEYIEFAVDGADRMRAMVDDLLAYSRVEQSTGEFESVDCDTVLERAMDGLQVKIEEHDAEITAESLPTVAADSEQVEQLFRNLVSNAIKYSGDDPPRIEITAKQRTDHWEFAVSDNGIGIDPGKTDRIFEVFKRLHRDDEASGTGIGLSLCQEIVDNHGGDIWVESEPGEGATFYFTLPGTDAG